MVSSNIQNGWTMRISCHSEDGKEAGGVALLHHQPYLRGEGIMAKLSNKQKIHAAKVIEVYAGFYGSQVNLATSFGVSRQVVSNWKGGDLPSLENIQARLPTVEDYHARDFLTDIAAIVQNQPPGSMIATEYLRL